MSCIAKCRIFIPAVLGCLGITEAQTADLAYPGSVPVRSASASPGGFYFGNRQMIGTADDTTFRTGGGTTEFVSSYDFAGYTAIVLGYSFGRQFGYVSPRIEVEGSFGNLSVDRHSVTTNGVRRLVDSTDSFGELQTLTGLVNGYLDFNLGAITREKADGILSKLSPYIGGGIGVTHATLKRQGTSSTGVVLDDSDARMTWQASFGVSYRIFDRTTVEVGFRHQRTENLSFVARDGAVSETRLVNNLVTLGARRQF